MASRPSLIGAVEQLHKPQVKQLEKASADDPLCLLPFLSPKKTKQIMALRPQWNNCVEAQVFCWCFSKK